MDWDRCTSTQVELEVCAMHYTKNKTARSTNSESKNDASADAASLNRQLLLVLEARGVPHAPILHHLDNFVKTVFAQSNAAKQGLPSWATQLLPNSSVAHLAQNADGKGKGSKRMQHTSWFRHARAALRSACVDLVRTKMRIPVPCSRRLLMVPDPCVVPGIDM